MEDDGPRPRYRWRKDKHSDTIFAGYDGKRQMGRVEGHHLGAWYWSMTFNHAINLVATPVRGTSNTARLAAMACEDCYDAVMAGTWPGITPEAVQRMLDEERFILERQ